jgi:hypothetical protein
VHVNCGNNNFTAIWKKVFRRITISDRPVSDNYTNDITPDDVEYELSRFGLNDLPIIQLDEFDQISDQATRLQFAELIKSLSDHAIHAKIILIGIAENAAQLIAEHASISRALKQVKMPRLSLQDLEKIVVDRYSKLSLKPRDEALFQIAFLSRGLPHYAHLLGRHSALSAIADKRLFVNVDDVYSGLANALRDVDQTIIESYLVAVRSQRPEETLYESVLIACSLAEADDLGHFQQSAVTAPLSEIAPRTPSYTPTTFAFHMNEFCEIKRGRILNKYGEARNFRYAFADPMMQPYVIMRALHQNKLSRQTFEKFIVRRQRNLPI